MLQEAIKNGAVSALAITTVSTIDELEALSVWDGRTVYVKILVLLNTKLLRMLGKYLLIKLNS